jgi:hypothetical protein
LPKFQKFWTKGRKDTGTVVKTIILWKKSIRALCSAKTANMVKIALHFHEIIVTVLGNTQFEQKKVFNRPQTIF